MRLGISTGCLYPMHTEESLELLLKQGFRLFEIFFNTYSELEPDYTDRLDRLLHEYSAQVTSIHPFLSPFESFLLFSSYERRFEDGLNMYERLFSAASRLNCDKLVMHGMRSDFSSIGLQEYFRRFLILSELGKKYGVTLLQENVRGFVSGEHAFLQSMSAAIDERSAFVLDVKQSVLCGNDPVETALVMGRGLRHVHISDMDGKSCVLPGKGRLDLVDLIKKLKKTGYDSDVIIEVYRSSFGDVNELTEARVFLEKIIKEEAI